jgi:hypothetical protein
MIIERWNNYTFGVPLFKYNKQEKNITIFVETT